MAGWTCVPSVGPRNGRKFLALCGNWCAERDLAPAGQPPTCPDCIAQLKLLNESSTAEDVFGTEPPGTPVPFKEFNPTAGYRPKEQ
jgi:hypothetical protein